MKEKKNKSTEEDKFSPMMEHYLSIKKKYPDCIIFYRLGDFYEMFFDDAVEASRILDLVLTGRECGKGKENRAPMCGVPYHAAEEYLAKLVDAGKKVAICEQLEDPSNVPPGKMVERGIIRIVTPGTKTNDAYMDERSNNFLFCIALGKERCGVAWCDITTGHFFTKKCREYNDYAELSDDLARISPAEIICNNGAKERLSKLPVVKYGATVDLVGYDNQNFDIITSEKAIKEHFGEDALTKYGISDKMELISACGALLAYLKETQMNSLPNIEEIVVENNEERMELDSSAIRNLELVRAMRDGKRYGSLFWLLDKCLTSMGARNLSSWILSPLQDIGEINYRLDGVEELYNNAVLRAGLIEQLKFVFDVERFCGKVATGNIVPQKCRELAESLIAVPNIKMILLGSQSKVLQDVNRSLKDMSEIGKLLLRAIDEKATIVNKNGGFIKEGFDKELDHFRNAKNNATNYISGIEEREKKRTGIKNLKISYNKVFGYYIEITNSFKQYVPYDYIRKQTLTNSERYITEELKGVEEEVLASEEKAIQREMLIYEQIKELLSKNLKQLIETSRALAKLDTLVSFAVIAKKNGYVRPEITSAESPLNIVGGRHPVVEEVKRDPFVPNDAVLDNQENRVMIITGPNMAGKSTYMRQIALITLMAHIGSFVPAKSAEIPIVDKIFTRVGASDNLIFDQSTFMVEMTEVADIIKNATSKSLLVLDEVGRGTSTYDGLSIAWSVVEYIALKIKAKTLFATHYHELSELEGVLEGVKNYKVSVKESGDSIVFLRKIARGSANKSFGIEVASLAGIPSSVTQRAKKILKDLEKNDLNRKIPEEDMVSEESFVEEKVSEVEEIIKSVDVNGMTPLDALRLISELKEKIH
ncbi:MAG: DNA mismatch repair protein MutS [Clostridia bacterium]|nr:DNA mismatch repair protein MutS [Clostridia bacterium]